MFAITGLSYWGLSHGYSRSRLATPWRVPPRPAKVCFSAPSPILIQIFKISF